MTTSIKWHTTVTSNDLPSPRLQKAAPGLWIQDLTGQIFPTLNKQRFALEHGVCLGLQERDLNSFVLTKNRQVWLKGTHLGIGIPRWLRTHLPMQQPQEMQVWPLGQEDPLEKETATHSSTLAWRTPRTEESGGLHPMGWQRVGRNSGAEQQQQSEL